MKKIIMVILLGLVGGIGLFINDAKVDNNQAKEYNITVDDSVIEKNNNVSNEYEAELNYNSKENNYR